MINEDNSNYTVQEEDEIIEGQDSELSNEDETDSESEDSEESSGENEGEVQVEESEQEIPDEEKHLSARDRTLLNKARRENYRYLTRIEELQNEIIKKEQEAEQLRYLNDVSTQTAMGHYEIAAKERLDRAKEMSEAAKETGDPKAITETDIALSKAVFEYEKLRGYKAEQELQLENEQAAAQLRAQSQQNGYQQPYRPPLTEETYSISEQWVDENDWFRRDSPNYDPNRHMMANHLMDNIDNYCRANGMEHLIGSQEYFNTLNKQLSQNLGINNQYQSQGQQNRRMQNMASRNVVAPARGRSVSNNYSANNNKSVQLSAADRLMAQRIGMKEQEYRKYVEKSRKDDYINEQIAQSKSR